MSDLSEAARAMGRKRTPKKAEAGRENLVKARERLQDEDVKAKLRAAQQARRERERQEREQAGTTAHAVAEKRPPGRPRPWSAEE